MRIEIPTNAFDWVENCTYCKTPMVRVRVGQNEHFALDPSQDIDFAACPRPRSIPPAPYVLSVNMDTWLCPCCAYLYTPLIGFWARTDPLGKTQSENRLATEPILPDKHFQFKSCEDCQKPMLKVRVGPEHRQQIHPGSMVFKNGQPDWFYAWSQQQHFLEVGQEAWLCPSHMIFWVEVNGYFARCFMAPSVPQGIVNADRSAGRTDAIQQSMAASSEANKPEATREIV